MNLVILGESGNFCEYVVSCKSSESGNLNVFGDYDECGNICECCYFGGFGNFGGSCDLWKCGWSGNSDKFYNLVIFVNWVIL